MTWDWTARHMVGWMSVTMLIGAAFIGVLVWALLDAARAGSRTDRTPEETLKLRLAQGDIDKETYERLVEELRRF